ncbi:C40 family peptidase [Actinoplanes sp. TBRC 11911]|nr:C40 family peptidase [Actinoplanes sp. TBRC 11911]
MAGSGSIALSLGLCLCAGQLVGTPAAGAATAPVAAPAAASAVQVAPLVQTVSALQAKLPLTAPASAAPIKAAVAVVKSKATPKVQTKYSTRTLKSGGKVKVTAKVLNPANGKAISGTVRLQALRNGKWINWGIPSKRLASGSATFSAAPKISGYFRVYYTGNGSFKPALSGKTRVAVTPAVKKKPTFKTVAFTSSTVGSKILAEAKRHVGAPYVFAASGPSRFDCSGYTMYVYRKAVGVKLPHKANSQQKYGKAVAKSAKKVGDLIVYRTGTYGYHVGIYAGGGYMYDSPHTGSTVGKHKLYGTNYVVRRLA